MKKAFSKQQQGKAAHRLGHRAESLCRFALQLKLYRIIEMRYKTSMGEIDIIAARGRSLVFIEVKARNDNASALQAVSTRQQIRLSRAAMSFLAHHPHYAQYNLRFDVMTIAPWQWPRHIKHAFESKLSPTFWA